MDINKVLIYLTEKVTDIPARPDNIHYTNFESLFQILQSGYLKGQNYQIRSSKAKKGDLELATARNSHKLTEKEKDGLSSNAAGGVRFNLFTNRILASNRGTRKAAIAELPKQREEYIKYDEDTFRERYGYRIPRLFDKNKPYFKDHEIDRDKNYIRKWITDHTEDDVTDDMVSDIYHYNRELYWLNYELLHREREERFILDKGIPVDKKYMEILIEKDPINFSSWDKDFIKKNAKKFYNLVTRLDDLFVQNRNFKEFKNYLRDYM